MGNFLVWNKDCITEQQLIEVNDLANNTPKYHSLNTHNWHIKRYGKCMYCELGSKAVPQAAINSLEIMDARI